MTSANPDKRVPRIMRPITIFATALCLFSVNAFAQGLTDRQRVLAGKELAAQWCAQCHVISPEQSGSIQPDVPSFAFIANKPDQTPEKIENSILAPHPPMPDLRLSRDTVLNLSLYILSLREEEKQ